MKVQRVVHPHSTKETYLVLGDDYLPVQVIQEYLMYIETLEYSPNTIRTYANALRYYWEFLSVGTIKDWRNVGLDELANFVHFLRSPDPGVELLNQYEAKRSESTINLYLAAVSSFYDFHDKMGVIKSFPMFRYDNNSLRPYKGLLHHISKGKAVRRKRVRLKPVRHHPKTLTVEQMEQLLHACNNKRDKFLISLLIETGMRIGQALGLRHSDIRSMDNEITIVPRALNVNRSRQKTNEAYVVHVSKELMALYTDYLIYEFDETDSDYVFVNLWEGQIGQPMRYETVAKLVERLRKKTGIIFYCHMFRHTHATELLRDGWDMSYVQKRLGHKQIHTTINTYSHITGPDLKQAIQKHHDMLRRK